MSRWGRLWGAILRWWRNAPTPPPLRVDPVFLLDARKLLVQYDDSYTKRIGGIHGENYSSQAAEYVFKNGLRRAPTLENEVRILAILLERIVGHLEEQRRIDEAK